MDLNLLLSSILIPSIIFLLFLFIKHFSNKKSKKQDSNIDINLPPSPFKLPILGNFHQLTKLPHLSLHSLSKKLGPIFYLQLGEIPTIVISNAKLARQALRTHDTVLSSRPNLYPANYLFYNSTNVVFSPNGDYWRFIRKICILELLSIKRVHSYSFVREQEVGRLVQRINTESCEQGKVNLSKLLGMYSNDVLCRVVFGRDFSQDGDYQRKGFQKMLEEYQELLGGFSVGDFFPSMEFLHTLTGRKARLEHTFQRFDRFFDDVISNHQKKNDQVKEHKDFVDILLEVQKKKDAEMSLTMDNVKAILLDMFAAGTDTTFITLDWGMTELLKNPRVLNKAQAEVRSVVGVDRKFVAESDLAQMPYTRAIIKEIFRLHPPAPVLVPRESTEDVIIGGYTIPKKSRLYVNVWAIGRDPESWKNPELFEPERFMDCDIDYRGRDFELIPFGAGRRICPGMAFGAATVELALAQLLHSFDWELPPGVRGEDLDLTEVFGITMHRIQPLISVAKPYFS